MKRFLSLWLLAVMLVLTACSGNNTSDDTSETTDNPSESTVSELTSEQISDDLPNDLDYDGYEFRVHSRYAPIYFNYTVSTDQETGDVVNDAIYKRDRALEERLNIKFTETTYDNVTEGQEVPRKLIMAGDDTYDLFVARCFQSFAWAIEGLLVDWNSLDYIDLDKPYWEKSLNDAFVLNDSMYFAAGAFNLTAYEWTHTVLFNKTIHEALSLDDPYSIVNDGLWTYDKFYEMAQTAVSDVNGDGIMDAEDRYGFVSSSVQILPSFWIGADTLSIKRDTDGRFYYSTPTDEKFITVVTRVLEMMWDGGLWKTGLGHTTVDDILKFYSDEHGLFANANFYHISKLRNMDADFGILPYPKWDEAQSEYISRIEGCEMPIVPVTNTSLERTGAILEALASESLDTVVPAYYDLAITGKYTRDEESIEMLDIITSNRVFDYGDTILCAQIRDGILATVMKNNDREIVSALEGHAGVVEARLKEINIAE